MIQNRDKVVEFGKTCMPSKAGTPTTFVFLTFVMIFRPLNEESESESATGNAEQSQYVAKAADDLREE